MARAQASDGALKPGGRLFGLRLLRGHVRNVRLCDRPHMLTRHWSQCRQGVFDAPGAEGNGTRWISVCTGIGTMIAVFTYPGWPKTSSTTSFVYVWSWSQRRQGSRNSIATLWVCERSTHRSIAVFA